MDDVTWLDKLGSTPHRQFPLSGLPHDMADAGQRFQETVDQAMTLTLSEAK